MQERFHRYCLTKEIASKPSGSVYLAHRINQTSPKLTLKVFKNLDVTSDEQKQKFLQELEKIRQLKHASIIPILDLGVEQGQTYVVREYVTSSSLRHRLDILSPQRMDLHDALKIIIQIGKALTYAHQQHIIHGNLKPENILFNDKGKALLADFGLASFTDVTKSDAQSQRQTLGYLAPEQLTGSITEKTDQYALACLAYELFTGQVPFSTSSVSSVAFPFSAHAASPNTITRKESDNRDQIGLAQAENACENSQCPDYRNEDKGNIRKFGKTRRGAQRWQCKTCQTTWSCSSTGAKNQTDLIPLSDLVPNLPESIEEAIVKALANDPSERYANISIFLRALEITLLLPTSPSTHSPIGSPITPLPIETMKPLGKTEESETPIATPHLLERWKQGSTSSHATSALSITDSFHPSKTSALSITDSFHPSKASALPITDSFHPSKASTPMTDSFHPSKTSALPITDSFHPSKTVTNSKLDAYRSKVEALPEGRLPQASKPFSPTLWLAFALSGIVLLLGTVGLYTLMPSQSPASSKPPVASTATLQPTVSITTSSMTPPFTQTTPTPTAQTTPTSTAQITSTPTAQATSTPTAQATSTPTAQTTQVLTPQPTRINTQTNPIPSHNRDSSSRR